MGSRTALITGITGQDGSYLAELLLEKGYRVCGLVRPVSTDNLQRIRHLTDRIELCSGDVLDQNAIVRTLEKIRPDEVYNLASQSCVAISWEQALLTGEITGMSVNRLLDSIREVCPEAKFYQASSSEMFGKALETPQSEKTAFYPRSPYGVAKVYGHYTTVVYRESFGMFACSGILFNHESQRRGLNFVTRKITNAVARIKEGLASEVQLGNLKAKRDWGHATDYVRAMWLMLQQDQPEDFVVGTGEMHTVEEFAQIAFERVGLDWRKYVKEDPRFRRPADIEELVADASKARRVLGWRPEVGFRELVEMMVDEDLRLLRHARSG
jgi:GDPmannose 4,6-dehydratase